MCVVREDGEIVERVYCFIRLHSLDGGTQQLHPAEKQNAVTYSSKSGSPQPALYGAAFTEIDLYLCKEY